MTTTSAHGNSTSARSGRYVRCTAWQHFRSLVFHLWQTANAGSTAWRGPVGRTPPLLIEEHNLTRTSRQYLHSCLLSRNTSWQYLVGRISTPAYQPGAGAAKSNRQTTLAGRSETYQAQLQPLLIIPKYSVTRPTSNTRREDLHRVLQVQFINRFIQRALMA